MSTPLIRPAASLPLTWEKTAAKTDKALIQFSPDSGFITTGSWNTENPNLLVSVTPDSLQIRNKVGDQVVLNLSKSDLSKVQGISLVCSGNPPKGGENILSGVIVQYAGIGPVKYDLSGEAKMDKAKAATPVLKQLGKLQSAE